MYRRKYLVIIIAITLLPLSRDILFYFLFHKELDITNSHDLFHTGSEMILMFIFGVFFAFIDHRLKSEKQLRKYLDTIVRERTTEIKLTQEISVEAFALLAEYRDQDTGNHLKRVQKYVSAIVRQLLEGSVYKSYLIKKTAYIEELMQAAILHDIGKVAISNEILLKPGKLTDAEFETMKTHTIFGGEILGKANTAYFEKIGKDSYLALARDIALFHHEKWDGTGYPHGLKEEKIPLCARILALCDVYDAVTIDRVYKKAWPHVKARDRIFENRGSHFDPAITDAFMTIETKFNQIRNEYKD